MNEPSRFPRVPAIRPDWSRLQKCTPILITAPTARCGTTLLQRLINSSRQAIIYGENAHFTETAPTALYAALQFMVADPAAHAAMEAARNRLADGETEFWSNAALPPMMVYGALMIDAFYRAIDFYDADARKGGFEIWGMKFPLGRIETIRQLLAFLPRLRVVIVYRDVVDCVASAKSRGFVSDDGQIHEFCDQWARNMGWIETLEGPEVSVVRYETLVGSPADGLSRLARFLQIEGMNPAVMERRINTFERDSGPGESASGYLSPTALTDEELKIVRNRADDMRQRHGYAAL